MYKSKRLKALENKFDEIQIMREIYHASNPSTEQIVQFFLLTVKYPEVDLSLRLDGC